MKLNLFFSLSIILFCDRFSFSQIEKISHNTKDFILDDFDAYPDDQGNIVVMYKKKTMDVPAKFFTYLVFSKADSAPKEIKLPGELYFKGYTHNNNTFTFIYRNNLPSKSLNRIFQLMEFTKDGNVTNTSQIDLNEEELISDFAYEGKYYFLTIDEKEELIKLRTINNSSSIDVSSIGIEKKLVKSMEDTKLRNIIKGIHLTFSNPEVEIPNDKLFRNKVAFTTDGKLALFTTNSKIEDKKGNYITSIILDFAKREYSTASSLEIPYKSYDFFIAKDKLYVMNASTSQIIFEIFSAPDFLKLASYKFNRGNTESVIFDSPFFINGEIQALKDKKSKINKFFSSFISGEELISALYLNGKTRIMLGSIKRITTSSFSMPGYNSTISTPYGSTTIQNAPLSGFTNYSGRGTDATSKYLYVFLDDNSNLITTFPSDKSNTDIIGEFVTKSKEKNRKSFSDYKIVVTSQRGYLVTNSNKSKLIKCFEWDNSAKEK
jgi:hypothetical protein